MKKLIVTLLLAFVAIPSLFAQTVGKDIPVIIEDQNVELCERTGETIGYWYQFVNNSDKVVAYVVLNGSTLVPTRLEKGESARCHLTAINTPRNQASPCLSVTEMKIVYQDSSNITLYNLEDYFRSNIEKAKSQEIAE